jgi:4-hydroxy-4-methyl-2-oxoglutarate aldolase
VGRVPESRLSDFVRFDSATLFNARSQIEGSISEDYTGTEIRCFYPELGPTVGYAVTSEWTTLDPDSPEIHWLDYFEYVAAKPRPSVIVMQDVDKRAGRAAAFGEKQARLLKRLGCAGVVTSVGVQDVESIRAAALPMFAAGVAPAHGPYHCVRFGAPVTVGRVTFGMGDLVFGDASGVVRLPPDLGEDILRVAAELAATERAYYAILDAPDFELSKLRTPVGEAHT